MFNFVTKRICEFAAIAALFAALTAAPASAHMTIMPRQTFSGIGDKYTVRVPAEGKVATTSAEIEIPEGVHVYNVQAPINWTQDVKRDGDRIVAIRWLMDMQPGEFMEFSFIALNPAGQSEIVWPMRQGYADGSSDDWTNGPDGLYSGAVTKLAPFEGRKP